MTTDPGHEWRVIANGRLERRRLDTGEVTGVFAEVPLSASPLVVEWERHEQGGLVHAPRIFGAGLYRIERNAARVVKSRIGVALLSGTGPAFNL
jgi:hypothetical protein